MLTTEQAAAALSTPTKPVSKRRVQQLIKDGTLKAEKFGRDYMVDEESIEVAKARKTTPGRRKGDPHKKQVRQSEA